MAHLNIEKGHVELFQTTDGKYHAIWKANENRYHYTPGYATQQRAITSVIRHKNNLESGTKSQIFEWFRNNPGVLRVELPSHTLHNMSVPMNTARSLLKLGTPL
jgi:hypothetical protein